MGQVMVGAVGQAAGFFLGGPLGASIGGLVGSLAGGLLFSGHHNGGSNITDMKFSTSAWGNMIPELYGSSRLPGHLLWCDSMVLQNGGKGKGKGGGKSGGKKGAQQPSYTLSWDMAFCKGPGVEIVRMWADGNLVYDRVNPLAIENNPYWKITVYDGSDTQDCHPQIKLWIHNHILTAPFSTPGFRGIAHVYFDSVNITPFGNRIPNITAECTRNPTPQLPGIAVSKLSTGTLTDNTGLMSVDWLRQRVYSISATTGLRVVDLSTNEEVLQKGLGYNAKAITVVPGSGSLYILDDTYKLYQLDPNSLAQKSMTDCSVIWPGYGGIGMEGFPHQLYPGMIFDQNKNPIDLVMIYTSYCVATIVTPGSIIASTSNGTNSSQWNILQYPSPNGFSISTNRSGVACPGNFDPNSDSFDFWFTATDGLGAQCQIGKITCRLGLTIVPNVYAPTASSSVTASLPITTPNPAATGYLPTSMVFDRSDNTLILSGNQYGYQNTIKIDTDGTVVWKAAAVRMGSYMSASMALLLGGGVGFWGTSDGGSVGGGAYLLNTVDGTITQYAPAVTTTPGTFAMGSESIYDSATNSMLVPNLDGNHGYIRVYFNRVASNTYNLASIIQDICSKADLDVSQIDTSLITNQVKGYAVTRVATTKDVLMQLSKAFFFDVVESDYTLKFVPRGQTPVETVIQDDLAEQSSKGDSGDYWIHTRAQQQDIPIQVDLKFIDQDNSYQDGVAYDKRIVAPTPTVRGKGKGEMTVPVVMSLADAYDTASKWLYTVWTERDTYKSGWGWNLSYLDPTDNVTVNLNDGSSYTVRISTAEFGADLMSRIEFMGEDMDTYGNANVASQGTQRGYVSTIPGPQFATVTVMNVPLLQDSDDAGTGNTRIYYGIEPYAPGWLGGVTFESSDAQTYNSWGFSQNQLTWGTTINSLPAPASLYAYDTINTINVMWANYNRPVSSLSVTDFTNSNGNVALLGNEIICFQNVSINADGSYSLSNLKRGMRGTEWAVNSHTVAESFILLDSNDYIEYILPLSSIGGTNFFKVVGLGGSFDTIPNVTTQVKGYDLKPYSPVNFSRTNSGSDLIVAWKRRTRIGGSWLGGTGTVPLSEAEEKYKAFVLSSPYDPVANNYGEPASYVRIFTGLTSPTFTYTAAEMSTDSFVRSTSTLYVVVFQISDSVGDGWPGSDSLPAF